ncbi:hypothetical protein BDV36DRAFT_279086 [Aspergillus pseudocaelatus]|uniref:Xylanolytic transcriptional activator regulatory domain-containing protein n=1 Tax=Aspergillus pseudocaelatus TaxID=1825620 RepID=A0ABQ6X2K3_9EURO|nr:hypothetical protein BDV36DRAFT_279086 [Aspergillus pseudocaelatus]
MPLNYSFTPFSKLLVISITYKHSERILMLRYRFAGGFCAFYKGRLGAKSSHNDAQAEKNYNGAQRLQSEEKVPLRLAIKILSERVNELHQLIGENSLQLPPMSQEKSTLLRKVLDRLGLTNAGYPSSQYPQCNSEFVKHESRFDSSYALRSPPGGNILNSSSGSSAKDPNSLHDLDRYTTHSPLTRGTFLKSLGKLSESPESRIINVDPRSLERYSGNDEMEHVVHQLSDRAGKLQIWPQNAVYGDLRSYINGLYPSQDVPIVLEEHLVNLYFSWHNPSLHLVDRRLYEAAKPKCHDVLDNSPFYSEALKYAMCCLGAASDSRFSPAFTTFPKTLAGFFRDRARHILEADLDHPTVSTVQTLVILSSHEIGNLNDSRGSLYSAMALRLAFDLGLHHDMSDDVSNGRINAEEAYLRRTVFFAAHTTDNLLDFYLGRPFCRTTRPEIIGSLKATESQRAPSEWFPYTSPEPASSSSFLDYTAILNEQHAIMCGIMHPCGYNFHGPLDLPQSQLQKLRGSIIEDLWNWKAKLPPALQINVLDCTTPYLPQVLMLHMQYYQNLIYIHRPFMSRCYVQPYSQLGPEYLHAREVCIESAISIAKILTVYETRYGFRRVSARIVPITSSAALMLLFAAGYHLLAKHGNSAPYLSTCFRALHEFSNSWESAERARNCLMKLRQQWQVHTQSKPPCGL